MTIHDIAYMDSRRIRITMISRNRIISSEEDRKMILKVSEVDPFEDIAAHQVSVEIYDTSPEVRGVVETKEYNYFSCFKNYEEACKRHDATNLSKALVNYFNEFSSNSPLMDFDEKVQHVCFVHKNHAREISKIINTLNSNKFK